MPYFQYCTWYVFVFHTDVTFVTAGGVIIGKGQIVVQVS